MGLWCTKEVGKDEDKTDIEKLQEGNEKDMDRIREEIEACKFNGYNDIVELKTQILGMMVEIRDILERKKGIIEYEKRSENMI